MAIRYTSIPHAAGPGFFEGWPNHPSQAVLFEIVANSSHKVLALDGERVIGFITANTDNHLTAFIPLLEVLPQYRGKGIGTQLVKRLLEELDSYYSIDLLCDESLRPFYSRLGFQACSGMAIRRYENQAGFSVGRWFEPPVLQGSTIRLEPLAIDHAADLAKVVDEKMFEFFPILPKEASKEALLEYINERNSTPHTVALTMIELSSGKAIGSSSMFDIREEDKALEIGHTWISKEHRGTKVNPEAKLLMLEFALETAGALRVQFKTDERNQQSVAALKKLGAVYEGTLRNHITMSDGYQRNSVFFSVTPADWPQIKENLLLRLKTPTQP